VAVVVQDKQLAVQEAQGAVEMAVQTHHQTEQQVLQT